MKLIIPFHELQEGNTMFFGKIMDQFAKQSSVTVMLRGLMENVIKSDLLDQAFEERAERQYYHELLFSSVVDLLGMVATGVRKSVNDAYRAEKERFTVSVAAVYDKLRRVETPVTREMIRRSAVHLGEVVERLVTRQEPLLRSYRTKIIDGNHLAATEHRLEALRYTRSGPLPGHVLVVLEPDLLLATDVFPCEDGHAQERSLLPQVLETVQPRDLWIADRNFCTTDFLFGIADRKGFFLIRQHAATLTCELVGKRRRIGRCLTGTIYEQKLRLTHSDSRTLDIRRVTIELDKPTRDGETEIHLLTNLSMTAASASVVAELYLRRWTIENAFQELGQALHSEINTLGYPKAALLSFCVALLAYNVFSVVKAALAAVHGPKLPRNMISGYYLGGEIAAAYHGMMIAVPIKQWHQRFAHLSPAEMAKVLQDLAANVRPDRFRKNIRGPRKPPPPRSSGAQEPHVSTFRLLHKRKRPKVHSMTA
jgi:hypothetical protein